MEPSRTLRELYTSDELSGFSTCITSLQKRRPASVLTATSKVYESIIYDQVLTHFSGILSSKLNGFRKDYSCETLLIPCIEDWKKAQENNQHVGCIMMNLSRAFDSLPHGLLTA